MTLSNDTNTTFETLTDEVFNWAEDTFPDRTDVSMFLKMYSEIGELVESGGDPHEVADLFILLLDYAFRKDIDITVAVRQKLQINRRRQWEVNENGVAHHV